MATTHHVGSTRVDLIRGDLTEQAADAIVNPANSALLGGGGVDGAIHRRGGPEILHACIAILRRIGHLETGEAVVTTAGRLPARWVVHTVGPVWRRGNAGEDALLARAWTRSLEEAAAVGARTIAFPAISTGVYRFPIDRAAAVSLDALGRYLRAHPGAFDVVTIVLFRDDDLERWVAAADALG